ncbi:MAG: hypothetical protein GX295_05035 [Syntrophomonadaceae bacterium]|nr:hypothetical protein [Syntrophomonadaceae bacterium]
MIHYTLMDPQLIWASEDDIPVIIEKTIKGVQVLLREEEGETWSIQRVISTNPNDYLRSELQPGLRIKFIPVILKN